MIDNDPIAACHIVQIVAIIRSIKNLIRDAVPDSGYGSVGDGNYWNIPGYIA